MRKTKKTSIGKKENYSHRCYFCNDTFTIRQGYVIAIYKEFSSYLFDDEKTSEEDAKERQMHEYICPDCAKRLTQHIRNMSVCPIPQHTNKE